MTYELDLVVPVEDGALEGVLRKVDPKRREATLLESEKTSRLHLHLSCLYYDTKFSGIRPSLILQLQRENSTSALKSSSLLGLFTLFRDPKQYSLACAHVSIPTNS